MRRTTAKRSGTSSASAAPRADASAHSWVAVAGSLLTDVLGEATTSLKDFADQKIAEHGPGYVKKASDKVAKASADLVTWAKDHPMKMTAAVAALVAASALLRAAMKAKDGHSSE